MKIEEFKAPSHWDYNSRGKWWCFYGINNVAIRAWKKNKSEWTAKCWSGDSEIGAYYGSGKTRYEAAAFAWANYKKAHKIK